MSYPGKHPDFIVHSTSPLNGGTPPEVLRESFITRQENLYIRNHGNIPQVEPKLFRLKVEGLVEHPLNLTLDSLRRDFPIKTILATLQCAGNRRSQLMAIRPIPGETPWGAEAVGTAQWTGVSLFDVLQKAGIKPEAKHVAFSGLDEIEKEGRRFQFGGSIPIQKALQPEVLLAFEINGEALPPAHGYPLRLVVPGFIGARSVKWLTRLTLQAQSSTNYYQAKAYRLFPPETRHENVVWERGMELGEFPVNTVICRPVDGARLPAGRVTIQGYALAGGGRSVERVDLSTDGGQTWQAAELGKDRDPWTWRFWEAEVELEPGRNEVVARGWDSAANTQPEEASRIWNFKGYMNNAWHRVTVLCPDRE
ncbi:MAG: sulfite oxidase [Acidobacteria bacterium]|nr:MAG: sulfite oxidase [Acidobacteriota bacterium]